jgi:pSer/pThr/pTyr-binding forkhead associated (FHA) protein
MAARLVWDHGGSTSTLVIGAPAVVIGRDASCQICVDVPLLAARHCRVVRHGASYRVEHLDGQPTRVNGTAIVVRSHVLAHGDEISCGELVLRFLQRPSMPLPRTDAETQRLPLDLAVARVRPSDSTTRIGALERELAEVRAELDRTLEENRRLSDENRRLRDV